MGRKPFCVFVYINTARSESCPNAERGFENKEPGTRKGRRNAGVRSKFCNWAMLSARHR